MLIRQAGESGQLYGSVSARDLSDAVTAAGFTVTRGQIVLEKPIKTLGLFPLRVVLHPEVVGAGDGEYRAIGRRGRDAGRRASIR